MGTFWPRFNAIVLVITLLAVIGLFATRAYGGPLDPPGTPESTDGVRGPGTPISSLPFNITQAGYYYVTRNLSAGPGQSGITICCSNVTVDLGGFTITGAGVGQAPGDGISNPGARNIVVRNGAVRAWYNGINLGGTYSRVERIQALSNLNHGIIVGPGSEVVDCGASINVNGIVISLAVVRNCTVMENSNFGIDTGATNASLIEHNRVSGNAGYGISMGGSFNMILNNQLAGNGVKDVSMSFSANSNVLLGNLLCTWYDFGTGNVFTDNAC